MICITFLMHSFSFHNGSRTQWGQINSVTKFLFSYTCIYSLSSIFKLWIFHSSKNTGAWKIGKELQNQFHPTVAHTNKNWPYFVQLGTVARSRVCLGSKWGRWQSKPWVTTPFDAIFVKFMHTPSFFSFQTGAVKGVDRFTISRFQLLLNSKIHGNNRGPFRTEN